MNGKHDQTHASLHVCTYVQASTCIYKHVCIHSYTKHECAYIHSMYNAYVCVYQYLFFSIYVHYLLFLISIQCTKCFMNVKSITKKHIKQCIRSYSNRNSILLDFFKICMHTIK